MKLPERVTFRSKRPKFHRRAAASFNKTLHTNRRPALDFGLSAGLFDTWQNVAPNQSVERNRGEPSSFGVADE